ncbi:MAG TPA: ABC transporter permease [Anaerolineae bacterium]|nr:ABC transporter permease [Anaerolineae bacterium]
MSIVVAASAGFLFLHGLIHLMGTASYLKLSEIKQLPYKTTVLGGRWDLGAAGTKIFGMGWALAAVGFVLAGVALIGNWAWWQPATFGVTLFSLVLSTLDYQVAFAGMIIDLAILLVLILGPWIGSLIAT